MSAAISLQDVRKVYSNGFVALKGINITVKQGDFYALLGPNGAGKSTAIGALTSTVKKTAGRIIIQGYDLDRQPLQAKALMGVVPQEYNMFLFQEVWDVLKYQAAFYGIPYQRARTHMEFLLKQLDLWDKRRMETRMLSGGMKRRLMIARALVHQPKVLILDEPTAGVDVEIRQATWAFLTRLNQEGLTILLTTHYFEEAENLCQRVAIIDQGEIKIETEMQALLQQWETETVMLMLAKPCLVTPILPGFSVRKVNDSLLEVDLRRGQTLNTLFTLLDGQEVVVESVRNKSNRLEQLFLNWVHKDAGR